MPWKNPDQYLPDILHEDCKKQWFSLKRFFRWSKTLLGIALMVNMIKKTLNERKHWDFQLHHFFSYPLDTECKLNVHKKFRRHPGSFLNVLCKFNLHHVSRGIFRMLILIILMILIIWLMILIICWTKINFLTIFETLEKLCVSRTLSEKMMLESPKKFRVTFVTKTSVFVNFST